MPQRHNAALGGNTRPYPGGGGRPATRPVPPEHASGRRARNARCAPARAPCTCAAPGPRRSGRRERGRAGGGDEGKKQCGVWRTGKSLAHVQACSFWSRAKQPTGEPTAAQASCSSGRLIRAAWRTAGVGSRVARTSDFRCSRAKQTLGAFFCGADRLGSKSANW